MEAGESTLCKSLAVGTGQDYAYRWERTPPRPERQRTDVECAGERTPRQGHAWGPSVGDKGSRLKNVFGEACPGKKCRGVFQVFADRIAALAVQVPVSRIGLWLGVKQARTCCHLLLGLLNRTSSSTQHPESRTLLRPVQQPGVSPLRD